MARSESRASLTCTREVHVLIPLKGVTGTELSPGRPVQQTADILAVSCVVTCREFEQESAEAILGAGSHPKGVWKTGNEPGE